MHPQTTCWSESIVTLVAFVTLLSADYVSENCRIMEELWSQVPVARLLQTFPICGHLLLDSLHLCHNCFQLVLKTLKYLLQQKIPGLTLSEQRLCHCHCCQKIHCGQPKSSYKVKNISVCPPPNIGRNISDLKCRCQCNLAWIELYHTLYCCF